MYNSVHRYGYSGKLAGAMYAIGEIKDAVPVIHGSAGCGFHYKYVCRRNYLPVYNSQCTELEEKDIIFGGADKLRSTVLETARKYAPSMIAVIPSASVDMIHDEIDNVIDSLKDKVDCKLVSLKSEKFSHVDKRNRKGILDQCIKRWDNCGLEEDFDYKGCGFAEAMKAMVEQVMEKQKVRKNTVNICGLAWGPGGNAIAGGMAKELEELGIGVNTYIPNCTTKEIMEAPKGELNIVTRRIQWAKRMEDIFGTAYFQVNSFDFYRGLEGIERLYLKISERLGIKRNISKLLSQKKQHTLQELIPLVRYLKSFRFALFTSSYKDVPYMIEKYERDFGISLMYVFVEIREESLNLNRVSEENEKKLLENMHDAIEKTGSKAQLFINVPSSVIAEALGEVDYVIGGVELGLKTEGVRYIQDTINIMPLDFEGFKRVVADFVQRIKRASVYSNLIIEKFKYQSGYYPMLNNANMEGTLKMWEKMWIQRRCET
jgi:nitrogenase molybdenum-iron protein alpha/beta subunit